MRASSSVRRRRLLGVAALVLPAVALTLPRVAHGEAPDPPAAGFHVEARGGPAFGTYLPIDPGGTDNEHLATGGSLLSVGVGYGWEFSRVRLDAGVRVMHLHLAVAGSYSIESRDAAFRANQDFVAPVLTGSVALRLGPRVSASAGLTLGTATFISDVQGGRMSVEQIPVFGTVEVGLLVRLTDWLDAGVDLAWVPPVERLNVFAPQLGARARF